MHICDASAQTSSENNICGVSNDGLETLEKDPRMRCWMSLLFFTVQDLSTSGQFQDISASTESCQSLENSLFSSMNISVVLVIGKVTRVKIEHIELKEQENIAPSSASSLNVTLEASQLSRRSLTGRPIRKSNPDCCFFPLNIKWVC
jgi:hypothetical protein